MLTFAERGDLAKARDLLSKAGYGDGFSADLVVKGKDSILREAQIIADQLAKVNIKLTITPLDNATFVARTYKKNDFQMGISSTALIGPDPDASTMTFYHSKTGVAYYAHDDAAVDGLLEQGQGMTLGDERNSHYLNLGKRLVDDSFYIYLVNAPVARAMSTSVKGFKVHPLDQKMTFMTTWLER
jgi:ABC-type transport system substrate-binding protein